MPASEPVGPLRVVLFVAAGIGAALGIAYVATRDIIPGRIIDDVESQALCVNQIYGCSGYTPPGSPLRPDAGHPPYAPLIVAGQKCRNTDGGTYRVLPKLDIDVYVDPMLCVETTILADGGVVPGPQSSPIGVAPHECACKAARFCSLTLPDGGTRSAPWGETLPYQGWTGADCFRKSCGEIAGISSWPPECPISKPADAGAGE
jgi:hypothetical protein